MNTHKHARLTFARRLTQGVPWLRREITTPNARGTLPADVGELAAGDETL